MRLQTFLHKSNLILTDSPKRYDGCSYANLLMLARYQEMCDDLDKELSKYEGVGMQEDQKRKKKLAKLGDQLVKTEAKTQVH